MISIKQDTEYMQNIVSASPIAPGKRFFSFSASKDNVGIISHGDDGNLYAVFGENGEAKSINLREIWKLNDTISCFQATQCDGKLWIAVATTSGSRSRFHIIHDIHPDHLGTYNPSQIFEADELLPEIHDVHLVSYGKLVNRSPFRQWHLMKHHRATLHVPSAATICPRSTLQCNPGTALRRKTSWPIAMPP